MFCFLTLSGLFCFCFLVFLCFSLLHFYFICIFCLTHDFVWFFFFTCFHLIYIYYNIFYNKIVSIFFFFFLSKIKTACTCTRARAWPCLLCVCVLFAWFCLSVASSFNNSIKCSICVRSRLHSLFWLHGLIREKKNENGKTRKTIHIKNQ